MNSELMRNIRDKLGLYLDLSLKEEVQVLLPVNLSRTYLIENCPANIKPEKWIAVSQHIVHTLIQFSYDKRYRKKGSYVELPSSSLKAHYGNGYKEIFIKNLVTLGIIECDGKYSTIKHKSFSFRLSPEYIGQPLKIRTITHPGIKKAIIRTRIEHLIELKERIRPIAHIARWAIDPKLQMNKSEALEYMELYKSRMIKEILKRKLLKKFKDEELSFVNSRYYRALNQIERWGISPKLSVDGAGGRLYTPITSLMSPLRNFLTYNDEQLVSFDLKNSQPLHFLLLLEGKFWKKGASGLTFDKLDTILYNKIKEENNTSPSIMYHKILETHDSIRFHFPTFRFLVENGKLYEFMSQRLFKKFSNSGESFRFNTRSKTKGEMLRLMYYNPKENYSSSHTTFQAFKELFPFEASVMSLLKSLNYKDFSILLQKLEAQILLHNICRKVFLISPEIPLFTIHDSITTTVQHADILEKVMVEEYTQLLGFPPPIKKEVLNSDEADIGRMKYVRDKIDQAEIEVITEVSDTPLSKFFPSSKCENWNIDAELKLIQTPDNHLRKFSKITRSNTS